MPRFSPMPAIMLGFALACASASTASALEQKAFNAPAFQADQAAGKPIVVHVTAPWCPTCTAQHAAIDKLATDVRYRDVTVYKIDFDSGEKDWKPLGVRSQSTMIAFHGSKETARTVGQTSPKAVAGVLDAALNPAKE